MRINKVLMVMLAVVSPPAVAANLFVGPGSQFETIQAAVFAASPGDRILVAAGNYTGAVIDKWVKISGVGYETIITKAVCCVGSPVGFLLLTSGADKTEISDLSITLSEEAATVYRTGISGVDLAGFAPARVAVHNVKFIGLNLGVFVRNTSGWRITDNIIDGLTETPTDFLNFGIWLSGSGNNLVANNEIHHDSLLSNGKVYTGINLSGAGTQTENNKIIQNTISIFVAAGTFKFKDIELFSFLAGCDGPIEIFDNKVIQNNADNILLSPDCLIDHNVIK